VRGLLRHPDRWLAAGFAAGTAVEALWRAAERPPWLASDLIGALAMLLLLLRRTRPLAALSGYVATAVLGTLAQSLLPGPTAGTSILPIIALLVLTFSLGRYGGRRELALGVLQPVVLVVLVDVVDPTAGSTLDGVVFFALFVVALPVSAGRLIRSRQRLLSCLHEQEADLATAYATRLSSARTEERLAVSDRLHDSVEIGLEALLEQTRRLGAGEHGDPGSIEHAARSLLAQTRDAVVLLSQPEPPADESPPRDCHSTELPEPGESRPRPDLRDAVMPWALLLAAVVGIGLLVETRSAWSEQLPRPFGLALGAALVAALASVWRWPLPATAGAWAAAATVATVMTPLDGTLTGAAVLFTTPFVVGLLEPRAAALTGLALCVIGGWATLGAAEMLASGAIATLAWSAGRLLRDHIRLVDEVRANHHQLARHREEQLRASVLAERSHIARDLHDAVGHTLTVVALQAGAARRLWDVDRSRSLEALATIGRVAQAGLAELRRGFDGDGADLRTLVRNARTAGVVVELDHGVVPVGAFAPIVFRVVQEGLTNAIRHSPGSTVRVRIVPSYDGFEVLVENGPARGRASYARGSQGLIGMRARVENSGGRLEWGPTGDGGFRLCASFPAVVPA
jgi:signal transduction histidine kinase